VGELYLDLAGGDPVSRFLIVAAIRDPEAYARHLESEGNLEGATEVRTKGAGESVVGCHASRAEAENELYCAPLAPGVAYRIEER
jgi:hypothetical protein